MQRGQSLYNTKGKSCQEKKSKMTEKIIRKKKNVNAVHYVDNKKFLEEIKKHKVKVAEAKAAGKPEPRMNDYLGDCILKIGDKVSTIPKFYGYSFREEMVSDGIENCILYFDRFDADKYDNPFAYYTQIMIWAFVRRINKEEKNRYIIYKNFEVSMMNSGLTDSLTDENDNLIFAPMYDNILVFIARYEFKELKKKFKRSVMKGALKRSDVEELINEIMKIQGVPHTALVQEVVGEIAVTKKQLAWFSDIMNKHGYTDKYKPKELKD